MKGWEFSPISGWSLQVDKSIKAFGERLKKDKKLLAILALGVFGMLLVLFSGTGKTEEAAPSDTASLEQAEAEIEERLTLLLKSVEGAGRVRVMVTVDSLYEKTVAINTESESGENEQSYKGEYVLIEQSGDSDGLVLKITSPVIRGVGITCDGGDSASVRQELIRLTSAALGIPVNRIWVTAMKE